MLAYPVNLEEDGKWLIVSFPDIPEGHSNGIGLKDALAMAADGLAAAISFYFDRNEAVPLPSKPKAGQHTVTLPLSVSAKILLWNEMIRQNVKPAELARRMGISRQAAQRLTDIRHATKIDTVAEAMEAVGSGVRLVVKAVAA
jgi:antitoxin HicB